MGLGPTAGKTTVPTRLVQPAPEPKNQAPFTKPAPTPKATPPKAVAPKPVVPKLTPAQLAQQAVTAALQPQSQALDAQEQQRENSLSAYTSALVAQLQGVPSQVAGDYQNAQNATNDFAHQAAAGLAAANPDAKNQALLAAIGAPAAQGQALAAQNNNVFNGGAATLYARDGAIPASQIANDQASALGYARALPVIQGLAGVQGLRQFQAQNAQAHQQLEAQRPQLTQQYLNSYLSAANAQRDYALKVATTKAQQDAAVRDYNLKVNALNQNAQALGLKTDQTAFTDKLAVQKLTQTGRIEVQRLAQGDRRIRAMLKAKQISVAAANARVAAQNAQPNEALSARLGYVVDGHGAAIKNTDGSLHVLPGFQIKNGQIVKQTTAKVPKQPTLSAYQVQKFRGTAATIAANAKTGFTDSKGVKHNPLAPADALNEMRQEGVPDRIAIIAINRAYNTNFNPNGKLP